MNLEKPFQGENLVQEGTVEYSRLHHPVLWEMIDSVCSISDCNGSALEVLAMETYQSLPFDTGVVFKEWQEDGVFEEKTKSLQEVIKGFLNNPTKENVRLITKALG